MRYKLIHEYPGSPKLGFTVDSRDKVEDGYYDDYYDVNYDYVLADLIENSPEFWQKLEPILYTEDFKDGSFPEKSCNNCDNRPFTSAKCIIKECAPSNGYDNSYANWQGQLQGEPIYEGDSIWLADSFQVLQIKYNNQIPTDPEGKFFANKENAEIYHKSLRPKKFKEEWEAKQKEPKYVIFEEEYYKVKEWTSHSYCILETGRKLPLEPFKDLVKVITETEYLKGIDKKKQFTVEKEANKLGFKIGDKVWNKTSKEFIGTIKEFFLPCEGCKICFKIEEHNKVADLPMLEYVTSRIAIHTPTKEDFEFITNKLHPNYTTWAGTWKYVIVNKKPNAYDRWEDSELPKHLELSIDEYMKSIGEKPLFVTEDGKNIYEGMKSWRIANNVKSLKYSYFEWEKYHYENKENNPKYFSTKQAIQDYLDSLKPKFEIGKWYQCKQEGKETAYVYYQGGSKGFGFNSSHIWVEHDAWSFEYFPELWKPADMNEVIKLMENKINKWLDSNRK